MSVLYKVKVINNPKGLPLSDLPVTTCKTSDLSIPNGKDVVADSIRTSIDGIVWFHIMDYGKWAIYQANGVANMRILGEVKGTGSSNVSADAIAEMTNSILGPTISPPVSEYVDGVSGEILDKLDSLGDDSSFAEKTGTTISGDAMTNNDDDKTYEIVNTWKDAKSGKDRLQQNSASYPTPIGKNSHEEYTYDWSINTDSLSAAITKIKRDMNIPSGYSRSQLNILMNNAFNRYKITYPDYMAHGLSGVAFFTRPDLNLIDESTGEYLEQVLYEPQLYYITRNNSMVLKQLTMSYSGSHEFIPLLFNACKSLDTSDESIETAEVGETFSGNKVLYAKHNIKSMVAGTFNCRFSDSYDMAVTHLFQGWCTYESNVYLGLMSPKLEYISSGIIDYAADAYVFMVDRTNAIKFWTKYYGVFPISVGKSAFSYNDGDTQNFPEQNIQFAYFRKEDLDPTAIVEFNAHSNLPLDYKLDHDAKLGHGGNTWAGPPFIELKNEFNGTLEGSDQLYLRYRPNIGGTQNMVSDKDIDWDLASRIAIKSMAGPAGIFILND